MRQLPGKAEKMTATMMKTATAEKNKQTAKEKRRVRRWMIKTMYWKRLD